MSRHIKSSDWEEIEDKVPDQVAEVSRSKTLHIATRGKGKKGKPRYVKLVIPRAMMPEIKRYVNAAFWDAETLDIPTSTASSSNFFTNIVNGGGSQNRLGDAILVDKVVVRLYIEQSTSITYTTADIAFVSDLEPAAGAPAWTDIFNGVGAAGAAAYHVAVPNFDKRTRFRYEKRASVPLHWGAAYWNGSTAVVSVVPKVLVFEIPYKRLVKYDGTAARPIAGSELMIWGWSDTNTNTPKATASVEVFFQDA